MPWNDRAGPVPHRTEEEMLALVRQKAHAVGDRRRRHYGVGTVSALLVVGLAMVVARSGPDPVTHLRTTGEGAATTTPAEPASTNSTVTTSTLPPPSTRPRSTVTTIRRAAPLTTPTTQPATAATTTTSTTTTLACRNSGDPACGPFRWDPPPGPNQPLTVTVAYTPAAPKAGDTVTFRVVVDDPDGSMLLDRRGIANDYGDGTPFDGVGGHLDCVAMWGPWTPPAPVHVHEELTFQHLYAKAGTYVAKFPFGSLGDCAHPPNQATGTATVTVTP